MSRTPKSKNDHRLVKAASEPNAGRFRRFHEGGDFSDSAGRLSPSGSRNISVDLLRDEHTSHGDNQFESMLHDERIKAKMANKEAKVKELQESLRRHQQECDKHKSDLSLSKESEELLKKKLRELGDELKNKEVAILQLQEENTRKQKEIDERKEIETEVELLRTQKLSLETQLGEFEGKFKSKEKEWRVELDKWKAKFEEECRHQKEALERKHATELQELRLLSEQDKKKREEEIKQSTHKHDQAVTTLEANTSKLEEKIREQSEEIKAKEKAAQAMDEQWKARLDSFTEIFEKIRTSLPAECHLDLSNEVHTLRAENKRLLEALEMQKKSCEELEQKISVLEGNGFEKLDEARQRELLAIFWESVSKLCVLLKKDRFDLFWDFDALKSMSSDRLRHLQNNLRRMLIEVQENLIKAIQIETAKEGAAT